MRWHLLQSFDKIYTIDLHGNSNKKETALDGSIDQNVFDIQQGVSINLFIKTGRKKENELANIFHSEIYGKRDIKYNFLTENNLKSIFFKKINPEKPYLFFVDSDNDLFEIYEQGIKIDKIFTKNSVGFVSANDGLNISFSKEEQISKIKDLIQMDENPWRIKYSRTKDARDWTYKTAKNDASNFVDSDNYTEALYRPFDKRHTLYTGNSRGLYSSPQPKLLSSFIKNENLGLIIPKINKEDNCIFISKNIISHKSCSAYDSNSILPLYLYPETTAQQSLSGFETLTGLEVENEKPSRTPNLNPEIVKQIADGLGMTFTNEKTTPSFEHPSNGKEFAPIDLLDYIYAVLHSPTYREKYKEFLKIDFPRVPYPKDLTTFKKLSNLGSELREIHLLESPIVEKYITQYPEDGDNVVGKPRFEANPSSLQKAGRVTGKVYINETQYLDNVPEVAWNFYIGGYQPAQKWLKDRKERELSYEDILHYQKIIVALSETDRIMKEIDSIEI
jgi:predicted helicase